ncbi:unnamed protein product [Arabis nemorensis]|uniref:Uncharacterized protein n=1 Tax=Arabis nemorensis TaxID=586526 RepID=A0A565AP20_9BRAS|nr:unnamed protein product [Arabis nemorensis]
MELGSQQGKPPGHGPPSSSPPGSAPLGHGSSPRRHGGSNNRQIRIDIKE